MAQSKFSPQTIGAPAKFQAWRRHQLDAIYRVQDSRKRFVGTLMPTGSGKSLFGWGLYGTTGERQLILTANRVLESTYADEFGPVGLVDIRGQGNYPCRAVQRGGHMQQFGRYGTTCEHGPCHSGVKCKLQWEGGCDYYDAEKIAGMENVVVSNYSKWIAHNRSAAAAAAKAGKDTGPGPLGAFDRIFCDEAHDLADEVCRALRVDLDPIEARGITGQVALAQGASTEDWASWAGGNLDMISQLESEARRDVSRLGLTSSTLAVTRKLTKVRQQLEVIAQMDDWVITRSQAKGGGDRVIFRPVWPKDRCEDLVYVGAPSVVLASATLHEKELVYAGIPKGQYEYVEYPSTFPLSRRPVYIWQGSPDIRVDFRMSDSDERIWISRIDSIIRTRAEELGRNGLIHCVSYARMKRIMQLSRYASRMIVYTNAEEADAAVRRFKDAGEGAGVVLLGPTMTQGVDFPDDECRWILVPKLPFEDGRDEVAERRKKDDPTYPIYRVHKTLAQSFGRGNRHDRDWCEGIIIDGHAKWMFNRSNIAYAPRSFADSIIWTDRLPEPLQVAA